jgi:uncharacterized protein YndB with AHSA1/START domain
VASQEALRRWVGSDLEIDLRMGGSYRMSSEGTWISGTVLDIVPEGALVLSWFEEGGDWVHPARLVIELRPIRSGAQVTVSHDGFAGIGKPNWPGTVEAYQRGADRHRISERLRDLVVADAG